MDKLINIIVIIAVLGVTGWLRMPYEQSLSEELHKLKLVPPRLSLEDRTKLKQKAFVATYGSLRPTIAAFMSSNSSRYHSDQEWDKIENAFSEIVLLDPYNTFYWDQASWHMASNAAADVRDDETLTEVRRKKEFEKYIQKGKDILNQGIRINPGEWKLLNLKAMLESNRHRSPNYAAAVDTYREILDMPDIPEYVRMQTELKILHVMQQLPERHQESYDYALELFHRDKRYRVDTVTNEVFIGQNHPLNNVRKAMPLNEIYGTNQRALDKLKIKWQRRKLGQKPYGVKAAIQKLENKLRIPQDKRLFPHKPLFIQSTDK